ncbi:MAG: heliorhodopsin HeR [Candidatus Berkelbacteria bacterium]
MEKEFVRLRKFNIFMSCLHFVQGVAMMVLSTDMKVPVVNSFLKFNPATQTLVPDPKTWFEVPLAPMIATFLFMSSLAHLLISLPGINGWYNKNLAKGANYARWIEYAFSSSVMILVISELVGITDSAALIGIFFANVSMILFGWMMELHNQSTQKTNWTAFIFGCIAGIAPWLAIGLYLWSPGSVSNPPTFVYWIFFSMFVFFNIFAVNQVLQYKKVGKWKNYIYGEWVYIVLSLVAKSLLAWQVFAGTLRP